MAFIFVYNEHYISIIIMEGRRNEDDITVTLDLMWQTFNDGQKEYIERKVAKMFGKYSTEIFWRKCWITC